MWKRKKRIYIVIFVIIFLLMCVPIKMVYKDGGTVSYKAVLWSYTKYHKMVDGVLVVDGQVIERYESDTGYYEETRIRILLFSFAIE